MAVVEVPWVGRTEKGTESLGSHCSIGQDTVQGQSDSRKDCWTVAGTARIASNCSNCEALRMKSCSPLKGRPESAHGNTAGAVCRLHALARHRSAATLLAEPSPGVRSRNHQSSSYRGCASHGSSELSSSGGTLKMDPRFGLAETVDAVSR